MAKKRESGLGRGLDALMGAPSSLLDNPETTGVTMLPIAKVEANAAQPRKQFDGEALDDLADSITTHGILQPITVRRLQSGYYQIISGERRWRAARQAGLSEVPVMIIEADDRKVMELSLIENLQREDLNPMEEAAGFQKLMQDFDLTQEECAQRVGKSRPAIANALRLMALPESIQAMVEEGRISAGHARALLALDSAEKQQALAEKISEEELSVRQTEQLVKKMNAPEVEPEPEKKDPLAVDYAAVAAKELGDKLGRRVKIVSGKRKGRLELEYYGVDDLNDLLEALAMIKKYQKK
jgi:ParB family transcriptional regulator, chromosome partitioning protein